MSQTTICLDFDGVIHSYTSKWIDAQTIPDRPVEGAVEFIEMLIDHGYEVAVMSARSKTKEGRDAMRQWMLDWKFKFVDLIQFVECKPPAVLYIDDRAYRFIGPLSWPSIEFISAFKPWNKGGPQSNSCQL
jgi:5'(3')-deoxyribonucleotidase